ncbi:DDE superfamily endonuclease [Streptomyces yunnanensis]|uniref:DDE superfamily endonuclease n=1 Tax=Streptomyces yunnanensis TaxID=156453 RepID=A0A9X8R014_9ACTN|nr:DDE superfamily endonuclease [Streptomyces yunnanensis]
MILIWDNLNTHLTAGMREYIAEHDWLTVFQLHPYAPDLNPVEGIWSLLRRGPLANVAFADNEYLVRTLRRGLRQIQYRPHLINGCLTETGLTTNNKHPTTRRKPQYLTGFVGPELPDVLALADVVVSRSGAGTLAELTALGKPAVFVPLASSAGNEQAYNARHLEEAGAAVALTGDVTAARLREALGPLLAGPARRAGMAEAARAHGRPDAADRLVDVILAAAVG